MSVGHETRGPGPGRVLEDPSGERRRRLRLLGRAIAILAFAWLAVVLLGGIGVGPASHLPFGHALRASSGPPPLRTLPAPIQPSAADLRPALPEPSAAASAPPAARPLAHGGKTVGPKRVKAAQRGRSATAPGHVRKPTTTTPGRSGAAPGQVRKAAVTTTAPTTTNPAGHVTHRRRGHSK